MNGAHDLGGSHGHGPINPDPNEPLFSQEWERRCFAVTLAMGFTGQWNIDQARFARETMRPGKYLETTYYEHWLHGLESLLLDRKLISQSELKSKKAQNTPKTLSRILKAEDVAPALEKGGSARRQEVGNAKFSIGDFVITKNIHPANHTRLPRYVRGRRGKIDRIHGVFVFPDTNSAGLSEKPQWLYAVRFEGEELWGEDAEPNSCTYIDLWDDYLEQA